LARTVCYQDAGVDLHIHTAISDGADSPAAIVDKAAAAGLSIIAVTDHDTTDGLKEAQIRGVERGVSIVRGIELSAEYLGHSVHILGLGIGEPDGLFNEMLQTVLQGRKTRNPWIIHKLNKLGFRITLNEVQQIASGDIVSRPHIAEVMMRRGYVADIDEAFQRFLNRGRPAYHERYRPAVSEATDAIHRMGGIALPAHPGLMRFDHRPDDLMYHFKRFKEMGIDGIETHYPTHSSIFMERLSSIAHDLNLFESGGSDYHGAMKPNQLGIGTGNRPIICADLAPLLEQLGFDISVRTGQEQLP
jgi:3',5'-nucleoside bisphosphate phosphatase